jgi:hypothetical protein
MLVYGSLRDGLLGQCGILYFIWARPYHSASEYIRTTYFFAMSIYPVVLTLADMWWLLLANWQSLVALTIAIVIFIILVSISISGISSHKLPKWMIVGALMVSGLVSGYVFSKVKHGLVGSPAGSMMSSRMQLTAPQVTRPVAVDEPLNLPPPPSM